MRFLEKTAQYISTHLFEDIGDALVLVPNKRTALFLEKELASAIAQPSLLPKIQTIEDFISTYSTFAEIDVLELNIQLYKIFHKHLEIYESFDKFYYWGEMLIRDFNDIDKNLIHAKDLFKLMQNEKEIDRQFQYLLPEQIEVIKRFWNSFNPPDYKGNQKNFVDTWNVLHPIYEEITQMLRKEGKAYPGMMFKEVAEHIVSTRITIPFKKVVFTGFHILSKSEELIFDFYRKNKTGIYFWDVDQYYTGSNSSFTKQHEAGKFLKQYLVRYPNAVDNADLIKTSPKIHIVSCSKNNGQIFTMKKIMTDNEIPYDRNTAVIMPDESILVPVLQALTGNGGPVNVTLGYNLKNSTINGLFDSWLDINKYRKKDKIFYKPIIKFINNAYIKSILADETNQFENYITNNNLIYIYEDDLKDFPNIKRLINIDLTSTSVTLTQIKNLVENIYYHYFDLENKNGNQFFETEVLYQSLKSIIKLETAILENQLNVTLETLKKLLSKYLHSVSVNFSGEPVSGLQIMGLLESRNLDFKNVFILNANEGILPATISNGSFIPYHLRQGVGLPTYSNNDSMFAYYVYRLLHKAENVYFFYNNVSDELSRAEPSRYIVQLELESGLECIHYQQNIHFTTPQYSPIIIEKSPPVQRVLERYYHPEMTGILTPSALNVYMDCKLKFYFKYIANLYEQDTLADEIDPATFGNLLHNTMQNIYSIYQTTKEKKVLTQDDVPDLYGYVDGAIEKAMHTEFSPANASRSIEWVGDNYIIQQILKQYAHNILKLDIRQLPRQIPVMEEKYSFVYHHQWPIRLGGRIDRIDVTDDEVHVIDYKTGQTSNKNVFSHIDDLFIPNSIKRKDYIFQIFLYSFLLQSNVYPSKKVIPELMFIRESYQAEFESAVYYKPAKEKVRVHSLDDFYADFKERLDQLISEFMDPSIPYIQTDEMATCKNCPYSNICGKDV